MASQIEKFDKFLLQQGLIDPAVFDSIQGFLSSKGGVEALKSSPLVEVVAAYLEAQKIFTSEDSLKARSGYFGLPIVDLKKTTVPKDISDLMSIESLSFYKIAPFALQDGKLKVAVYDPSSLQTLQALEFLGQKQNLQIELYLASLDDIVSSAGGGKREIGSVVGQAVDEIKDKDKDTSLRKNQEDVLKDAPTIKIVDVILSNAIESGTSDIHIEPTDKEVRVRYRIDGVLHNSLVMPRSIHPAIITRVKILSNLKIDETRLPQDGRFHFEHGGKSIDLRVSILPLIYGEKIVMRLLDKSVSVPTLEQLGLIENNYKVMKESLSKAHGIVLITGPTGSGKSTTLYSMLSIINVQGTNIITMEDPVEYFIPGVNQSQVNPDIGLTFASGLRSILRQDPNVIMVGEIRDAETAELSVHAALTGHLVFSTLHTNNAVGAIPRLVDMGVEPFLIIASLSTVAAQRLVRKICDSCKVEVDAGAALAKQIQAELATVPKGYIEVADWDKLKIFKGKGCARCDDTGYKGRVGVFEILQVNAEIQKLIAQRAPEEEYYKSATKIGMLTLKQDGFIKVVRGMTTIDEILRITSE